MKTKTPVTPDGLRAAARAIIYDGEEGTSASNRHANERWTERLVEAFTHHYQELMDLCITFPPDSAAELRLLQYVLDGTTGTEARDLITAAMA